MTALRLPDFLAQETVKSRFVITPYIPLGGITLLYGKTKVGKSPLTWEMARCVAAGELFFGCSVIQGPVLYLDFDTPADLVRERLSRLETPPPDFFIEFPGVKNLFTGPTQAYFRQLFQDVKPILVIFNTLRKLHQGDEKDGSLPSKTYATLQALFPGAGLVVVHHDKKTQALEASGDPSEAFSGHMAWLNDAQVGLHLIKQGGRVPGLLSLHHKTQVSEERPPLTLQLGQDGTAITAYLATKAAAVFRLYHELTDEMGKTDKVRIICKRLDMSERSVWTYLSRLDEVHCTTAEQS